MPRLVVASLPSIRPSSIRATAITEPTFPPLGAIGAFEGAASEGVLIVSPVEGDAIALGAFQRARSTVDLDVVVRNDLTIVRRATGGPAIRMRKGQLFVSLALRAADALGGVADVNRALNRHVRPLLAALTSVGSSAATYGGRDFVSMAGSPVSWVGVRHLRETGLVAIEAIVAVDAPFAIDPELDLAHGAIAPRFLGKIATSLCAIAHRDVEIERVARAVVDAYCAQAGGDVANLELTLPAVNGIDIEEPPFDAMVEESIGLLGARIELQRVALGGDWMISEDVVTPLGRALFALGPEVADDALFRTIDEHLSPNAHTLLVGVKQLSSIAKLVRAAWAATKTTTRG